MGLGSYFLGLVILAGTWGSTQAAAWIAVVRLTPRLTGAPRVLAYATIGLAALVAAYLVPGALGILSRWTALVAGLAMLAAVWRFLPRLAGAPQDDMPAGAPESGPVSWAIAALAVAAVGCWTVAKMWAASREASVDIDTLTFHLPDVGRWLETGSIWQVDQFTPLLANGNYPHNGDLVFASVVAPFESDAFVRVLNAPFVFLAGLAVYAIARELAAPRATAVLCGALFAALPVVTFAAYDGAKTDPMMWAAFGAGSLFALRSLRMGETSDLVLAGVGFGLAFGTKWYGVPAGALMVRCGAGQPWPAGAVCPRPRGASRRSPGWLRQPAASGWSATRSSRVARSTPSRSRRSGRRRATSSASARATRSPTT